MVVSEEDHVLGPDTEAAAELKSFIDREWRQLTTDDSTPTEDCKEGHAHMQRPIHDRRSGTGRHSGE